MTPILIRRHINNNSYKNSEKNAGWVIIDFWIAKYYNKITKLIGGNLYG